MFKFKEKKSNLLPVALCGFVLLVLIGAGAYFYKTKNTDQKNQLDNSAVNSSNSSSERSYFAGENTERDYKEYRSESGQISSSISTDASSFPSEPVIDTPTDISSLKILNNETVQVRAVDEDYITVTKGGFLAGCASVEDCKTFKIKKDLKLFGNEEPAVFSGPQDSGYKITGKTDSENYLIEITRFERNPE